MQDPKSKMLAMPVCFYIFVILSFRKCNIKCG